MFIILIVVIVSQVYIYIPYIHVYVKAHRIVYFKYVWFIYINYTLIKLSFKKEETGGVSLDPHCSLQDRVTTRLGLQGRPPAPASSLVSLLHGNQWVVAP